MRYKDISSSQGVNLDLVVSNTSTAYVYNPNANGKRGAFGQINLMTVRPPARTTASRLPRAPRPARAA